MNMKKKQNYAKLLKCKCKHFILKLRVTFIESAVAQWSVLKQACNLKLPNDLHSCVCVHFSDSKPTDAALALNAILWLVWQLNHILFQSSYHLYPVHFTLVTNFLHRSL